MAYTTTGSVSYDTAAYDLFARLPLRSELYFEGFVEVKPTNTTHRGSSVIFWQQNDLAVTTTILDEDVDVTPVALSNTSVEVTLRERGNATVTTARVQASSMIDIDQAAAEKIGRNAGESLDTVVSDIMAAGTNVRYAAGDDTASPPAARADLDYGASGSRHTIRGRDFLRARADLVSANVARFPGGYYMAMLHPDVVFDLKLETDLSGWLAPEVYSNRTGGIGNGEIGMFHGFRVIESPRAPIFADGGAAAVDAYRSLFWGREAMAKAYSTGGGYGADPVVVRADQPDLLKRFYPIGWKHFVGYSVFRQAALRAVESASSIGTN